MATITDYASLKANVADWLNRPDLTTAIETFVHLADKRLARDLAGSDSFTELSSGNTTNWLLASHPDVYLYATLVESAPYLKDDERVVVWEAEYAKPIGQSTPIRVTLSM